MATIAELGALPPPVTPQAPQGNNTRQMLLSLLPILAALKSGGVSGAGGFAQGWTQGRTYLDEQKKRDALIAQQQADAQAERQRQDAAAQDRKRKDAFDLLMGLGPHIGNSVLSQMDQNPNLDPTAAAGAEAQKYADLIGRLLPNSGIQAGDIQTMMPDVKTANSARVTKHAQEVLANLKGYKTSDLRAMGPKIPFMGRAVTYDELLNAAGSPQGLTPTSEQPKPDKPLMRIGADKRTIEQVGTIPADATMLQEPQPPRVSVNMGGMGGGLTPEGIDFAATQYRVTGIMPPLGMGGGPERKQIINAAATQARDLKQTPAVAIQKQAAFKADAAALQQMRKMGSAAQAFETKAIAQADIVADLSARVGRSKYPILNTALLAGKREIAGDPDAQLLLNAITTFSTEYAKIMEGSTGSVAASTDSSRKAAERLINTRLNPAQMAKALDLMKREMRLTIDGYDAVRSQITQGMGGGPGTAPANETPEQRIKRLLGGG